MSAEKHLFPTYARFPLTLVRGSGSFVWDDQGRRYLDYTSGIAVCSLGHVPPKVKARVEAQLDKLWHTSNLFQQPLQEKLAEQLTRLSGLDAVFFCNSGAEANEGAIKLARRYAQKVMKKEKYEVITFEQSFHGRTLATLTATGQDKVKEGFAPLPAGFVTVPYNDIAALKKAFNDKTCAVLLEVVQGEGGIHCADQAWLETVRELCDAHDALLMIDEIQSGMCRTGSWFAYQQTGVQPDVVTLAKSLGSGLPIGAVLGAAKTAAAFATGSHGSTFGGNPLAVTAALATVEQMETEGLADKAKTKGEQLQAALAPLIGKHGVEEVRGRGLMIGIALSSPAAPVIDKARENGLLILSAGPQVLRILPPLITSTEEIRQAAEILTDSIRACANEAN
jgi:acetylornithine aminotransferase